MSESMCSARTEARSWRPSSRSSTPSQGSAGVSSRPAEKFSEAITPPAEVKASGERGKKIKKYKLAESIGSGATLSKSKTGGGSSRKRSLQPLSPPDIKDSEDLVKKRKPTATVSKPPTAVSVANDEPLQAIDSRSSTSQEARSAEQIHHAAVSDPGVEVAESYSGRSLFQSSLPGSKPVYGIDSQPPDSLVSELAALNPEDPFEKIPGLAGFGLSGIRSAMIRQAPSCPSESTEVAIWQGARGGERMLPVKASVLEKMYVEGTGSEAFRAPKVPHCLSLGNRAQDDNNRLSSRQKKIGAVGHSVVKGLALLNQTAKDLHQVPIEAESKAAILPLISKLKEEVAQPLGHALRMLASEFNELGFRRRHICIDSVKDAQAKSDLKDIPMTSDRLFDKGVDSVMEQASKRQEKQLLAQVLKLPREKETRSAPSSSFRPSRPQQPRDSSYQGYRQQGNQYRNRQTSRRGRTGFKKPHRPGFNNNKRQ